MLGVELVNELVQGGKIELTTPVERTVTYHDPCRLNKRKGVHKAPRELLDAVPGITFHDVDRVTQWSYCSGGGGGLPIEKPEITEEISRRRVDEGQAARRRLDTLISACPWSERPLTAGRARRQASTSSTCSSWSPSAPGSSRWSSHDVAFKSAIDDAVIAELRGIIGDDERVLDDLSSRAFRSRVPAPFPVHRWADHMPDVAVLPKTAEEVSARSSSSPTG